MWKTKDGYSLTIPEASLEAFAAELEASGETEGGCPTCARAAVANEVRRMVRGSRRSGTARGRRSGRRFPVFSGRGKGGAPYRLVARPTRGRGGLIVGMDPSPITFTAGGPDCGVDNDCDGSPGADGDDGGDEFEG